jgi:sarcosine oxidase, subunit beta
MLPGMSAYFQQACRALCWTAATTPSTRENRPLIGPLPVEGAYLIGALSGYGLMASCAAGELLAAHLTASPLPPYAPAFDLTRYQDRANRQLLDDWGDSGQL